MHSKGQILSLDFIIAVILVVLAIGVSLNFFELNTINAEETVNRQVLKSIGETAADLLLSNPRIVCELVSDSSGSHLGYIPNCVPQTTLIPVAGGGTGGTNRVNLGIPSGFNCLIKFGNTVLDATSGCSQTLPTSRTILDQGIYSVTRKVVSPSDPDAYQLTKSQFIDCTNDLASCPLKRTDITLSIWRGGTPSLLFFQQFNTIRFNTVLDNSGNLNNGTVQNFNCYTLDCDPNSGLTTTTRNGHSDTALNFDGLDDYISAPPFSEIGGNKNWTVAFWMKYTPQPSRTWIMSIGKTTSDNNAIVFLMDPARDEGKFGFLGRTMNTISNLSSYRDADGWIFVATTYNATSPTDPAFMDLNTYIGGTNPPVKVDDDNVFVPPTISTTDLTYIAKPSDSLSGDSYYRGMLDEICIYKVNKTPAEISTMYTRGCT